VNTSSEHVLNASELNLPPEIVEALLISRIAKRALPVLHGLGARGLDLLSLNMDIEAVHKAYPLDLVQLLDFDDFNFNHDVIGIYVNLDRQTKALRNCFSPRCTV